MKNAKIRKSRSDPKTATEEEAAEEGPALLALLASQCDRAEAGRLRMLTVQRRAAIAAELRSALCEERAAAALRRADALCAAQIEGYRTYVSSQVQRARRAIADDDRTLQHAAALEELRAKLKRFGEFLAFESGGIARCVRIARKSRVQSLLASWGVSSEGRGFAVVDLYRLENALWEKTSLQPNAAVRFARLPRAAVQRTAVHGLGEVPAERLEDVFEKPSHVLAVIEGKQPLPFPLPLWKRLEDVALSRIGTAGVAPGGSHFALVIAGCCESDESRIDAAAPEGLVPVAFVAFEFVESPQTAPTTSDSYTAPDKHLVRAIARKEQEFLSWIEKQTTAPDDMK